MSTDQDLLDQIATSLGRSLTAAETAQAALWLAQARILLKARLGDLGKLDQDALDMVLVEVVVARLRRPDPGSTSTSRQVSVDDGSVQQTTSYERSVSPGDIADWMWELLSPQRSSGAFSINLSGSRPGPAPRRRHCWPRRLL